MDYEHYAYRADLEQICCYQRDLQRYAYLLSKGVDINLWRLNFAAKMKELLVAEFLDLKKQLGLKGGVEFLTEDNSFLDFEIDAGHLTKGKQSDIYSVTEKWIEGFPDDFNAHNFEVAVFARVLANPDYISDTELYTAKIRSADRPLIYPKEVAA